MSEWEHLRVNDLIYAIIKLAIQDYANAVKDINRETTKQQNKKKNEKL